MDKSELDTQLARLTNIVSQMLDEDIFPWVFPGKKPTSKERNRASTVVADRLCGAVSDPIIRNAQEKRQLANIGKYLKKKGYRQKTHPTSNPITEMQAGTYCFRLNVVVGDRHQVNIPVDTVIQPRKPRKDGVPIFIEAKSAGDFTNVNKRRKEEATKVRQLKNTFGDDTKFILLLCGYFDSGYLGYEAAEGIDWVWEHRIEAMDELGI